MKVLSFLTCCILSTGVAFAENSYVKTGSIGKAKEEKVELTKDQLAFRPMKDWIGEKFIFLPMSVGSQQYGYQGIEGGNGKYGHPTYEECVGRIGKVIKTTEGMSDVVSIQMEDNGHIYTAKGYSSSIMGIAPVLDLDFARNKWIGKTLYNRQGYLVTYDENTDKINTIKIKKYSPVKVLDIVAGWHEHQPIRFILQSTPEKVGYLDIDISGTNVSQILQNLNGFEKYFLNDDPRKYYKWSQKIWSAIEQEKVFVGMTAEQAIMSWGEPTSINTTTTGGGNHEQWVYKYHGYLYFDNKILTSIQN